jgi:transposase-like protein
MAGTAVRTLGFPGLGFDGPRGVSYAQASHDLGVHQSQLRGWVKALADDPQHAFPGRDHEHVGAR